MKYTSLFVALCLVWSLLSVNVQAQNGYRQQGKASYYAAKFDGRETASGEIFTNDALTAAHLSIPFNSLVKVTNVRNGKSVVVRINDRGPHIKARILDMSKAAAKEIDMIQSGIATVDIEVLATDAQLQHTKSGIDIPRVQSPAIKSSLPDPDKKITLPFTSGHTYSLWGTERFPKGYGIQVASFADLQNAKDVCKELLAAEIKEVYLQVEWKNGQKAHRILVGSFDNETEAQACKQTLEKIGFEGFVKRHISN
jgi:rare lipoprotein A